MITYDDAVAVQMLARVRKMRGRVTSEDVLVAFKSLAAGVLQAIEEQRPDVTPEQVDATIRRDLLPGIITNLRSHGVVID